MTNTTNTRRSLFRAARLGAMAGLLGRFAGSSRASLRCEEDLADECRLDGAQGRPWTRDMALAYRDAWHTAWERGQVVEGRTGYHLTAPAARSRA